MKKIIILNIFFLLFVISTIARAEVIKLGEKENYNIGLQVDLLEDESKNLNIEDILKSDKFNKALATMGDHRNIDFTLKGIGLVGYFGVELGAEDVQRGKPHPDIFIQAAGNMNVQPYECLVFEDSFSGIEAARKAGMEVVVLSTTHSREELKVLDLNYVINDYEDPLLCELIEYYSN